MSDLCERVRALFRRSPSVTVHAVQKGCCISIDRKGRFVMKDGRALLSKLARETVSPAEIILSLTGPLCSKTAQYLREQGMQVQQTGGK
ncbi:MAG: hypothetical protein ACQEQV_09945 [Fibrobacterota bacterium]